MLLILLLPLVVLLLQDHAPMEGLVGGLHDVIARVAVPLERVIAIPLLAIVVEDVHWLQWLTALVR